MSTIELQDMREPSSERTKEETEAASPSSTVDHQIDGGLTAWCVVAAAFLLLFNSGGTGYCFGVYHSAYKLGEYADTPEFVRC